MFHAKQGISVISHDETPKTTNAKTAFHEDENFIDNVIDRIRNLPKSDEPKRVRIPLMLSEKATEALDEIGSLLKKTRSDVLRIGFGLLMRAVKAEIEGLQVCIVNKNDEVVERLTWK